MRLHEEFQVDEPIEAVWSFFERPELVGQCLPGVDQVRVIDQDHVDARVTQTIGPMSATIEASVEVLERVTGEMIRFRAIGRSVRGAAGHIRSTNEVRLHQGTTTTTTVAIDSEVVLAGPMGSVGQKVVSKQASKVAAQFSKNLQSALHGEPAATTPARSDVRVTEPVPINGAQDSHARYTDWSQLAAVLSGISAALAAILVIRSLRKAS